MKQIIFLLMTTILLASCSKKESGKQPSTPIDEFAQPKVTADAVYMNPFGIYGDYIKINFMKYSDLSSATPNPTISGRTYLKDDNGVYKLVFKGEGGSQIIARDAALLGGTSTGVTYSINYSDTFFVYKVSNNSLWKTIILNKESNPNRSMYFTYPTNGATLGQTRDYVNNFVQNIMPGMRFNEQ